MAFSFLSLLTVAALAADPEIEVRPLTGEPITGRLMELSAKKIVLETASGREELSTSTLMWLQWPVAAATEKPVVWIDLLDGSKLAASGYISSAGKAQVLLGARIPVEIPTRSIDTVRFRQQTPELALQWREITSSQATSDMIVTRKTSMRTIEQGENEPRVVTEQALDPLEGTLHEVTESGVVFEIDGEKVPIRREKLEGLVYYHAGRSERSIPVCRLIETNGTTWQLREVSLADGQLNAVTTANISLSVPMKAIAKLDFSVGNVAFLSELEADSGNGEMPFSLQPPGMTYKFGRVFQARTRPPLGADSFRVAGRRFDSGLSLHSPLKLVYRVPEGFRKFLAWAGIDDSVVAPGRFNLIVLGDGKELARYAFSAERPRQAISLDLDVGNVRRVTIVLESADGQDIGDQLDLCEARFTK